MTIRLLDEVVAAGERGVLLFAYQAEALPPAGSHLLDAQGQLHLVETLTTQEEVSTLLIPGGDLAYFERLFRNVRVDATLFQVQA